MRPLVVLGVEALSPSVRALALGCPDGGGISYVPGQWINLHVEVGGGVDKRAYSIASAPDPEHPERFEIAVTRVETGQVSRALHTLPVGARLAMDGPHGFFTREAAETHAALLVGTGTGVCPLRAMIQAELRNPTGPKLALLLGARTEEEILYRAEFEALARKHARFEFYSTLSRPHAAWRGLRGYVQGHLRELLDVSARPHVYVCGLTDMVSDTRRVLKEELGLDRKQIHSERYD
jgi:CDP-4-dehydro-6-deoxyglucose reductase, E3